MAAHGLLSGCGEQRLLYGCGRASRCGDVSCCRARALELGASVDVASMLTYREACGIFLDQGLNACPLRWQADS